MKKARVNTTCNARILLAGCSHRKRSGSRRRLDTSVARISMSITLFVCFGAVLSAIACGKGVDAAIAVTHDPDNDTSQTDDTHTKIPVAAPGPDTPLEYPIRVMGRQPYPRLPDYQRCRWLPSGPDVWVANTTKTQVEPGSSGYSTSTHNTETLDQMFRRIVDLYQTDERLKDKLTIASSPDALPPKVQSDYRLETEEEEYYVNDNAFDADDPYSMYLHEGDGGPWVLVIDDFLHEKEATRLVELGREQGYVKSTIVTEEEDEEEEYEDDDDFDDELDDELEDEFDDFDDDESATKDRTSSNAWCTSSACKNDKVTQAVRNRIYELVRMEHDYAESFQLLHYTVGEYYNEHHDYFYMENATEWSQDGGRVLTVFLYLNDVEAGGETEFPRLNLTVTPKMGRAVLWPSVLDQNPLKLDWRTEHAAREVTQGIKYGANLWFHRKPLQKHWHNYECDAPEAEEIAKEKSKFSPSVWLDDEGKRKGIFYPSDSDPTVGAVWFDVVDDDDFVELDDDDDLADLDFVDDDDVYDDDFVYNDDDFVEDT